MIRPLITQRWERLLFAHWPVEPRRVRPLLPPIPELNVRTYVRHEGVPAVWFLSLDTNSPLFVTLGRALFGLPYHLAQMAVLADGDGVHYLSSAGGGAF